MAEDSLPKTWRWYHALLFWSGDPSSYAHLMQASFAPPVWTFAMWIFTLSSMLLLGDRKINFYRLSLLLWLRIRCSPTRILFSAGA